MKIYIAGSITNNPNYKWTFEEVEKDLTAQGHVVLNPVKNLGFSYKDYIDMGLCELMKCDAIYMIHGWEESSGAKLEHMYALTTNMKIFYS